MNLYELRLYHAAPGCTDRLNRRYREFLPALFDQHGMSCVGIWTALSGPDLPLFVYCLAFADMADRAQKWASFYQDPEWWHIREETNAGAELVDHFQSLFLTPIGGSSKLAEPRACAATEIHDLILINVGIGQIPRAGRMLEELYLPTVTAAGATKLLGADITTGRPMPAIALLLSWPDDAVRRKGWQMVAADKALQSAMVAQQAEHGRPALGRMDIISLEPAPFHRFSL